MTTVKERLYNYAYELYKWELDRKEVLNGNISVPLAIITLQIGSYATMFSKMPTICLSIVNILFYLSLLLSLVLLCFSIYYFAKHQIGHTYGYISSPKEIDKYYQDYSDYLRKKNESVNQIELESLNEIDNTIYVQLLKHTEINKTNNEKKIFYHKKLKIYNVITTVFIVITLAFYAFSEKLEHPINVNISNLQGGVIMTKDQKPEIPVAKPATPVAKPETQSVAPTRPEGKLITEGFDPSKP